MTTTALDRLRAVVAGGGAIAPVHVAFGSVLDAVSPGKAVARIPALPPHRLRGPGVVPVLGDLVLSAAITSTLPAGMGISTLTLHVAMLGPLPAPGAPLVATAELLPGPAGPPDPGVTAVSRAEVCAVDGRPVAHLTARCVVVSLTDERPLLRGDRDSDPFAALGAGAAPVAARALANAGGGVQGGVLAALLGDAIRAATDATVDDLDVTFLRAVPADDGVLTIAVEPVHSGRRLAAARAELRGAAGRTAVVATSAGWRPSPG